MEKTRENILETICIDKWNEVARQKEGLPLARLQQAIRLQRRPVLSLKQALAASPTGIIAEFKRRSPSRGWIAPAADVTAITAAYQQAGAAAVSCLTDEHFFSGSLSDFEKARAVITRVPLLRKEFIVDEYQVYQSRVMGADAILLIAACLTREDTAHLSSLAHYLGMETLLEIHDPAEVDYILPDIAIVGVNNRALKTFTTDPLRAASLVATLPSGTLKIAESGITSPSSIATLRAAGFSGFLVGEYFMRAASPGDALQQFINSLQA